MTVSYTHLDVYKRQDPGNGGKEYYNNMMHKAYNEPHFLDNKK